MKKDEIKKLVAKEHPDWVVLDDDDEFKKDSATRKAPADVQSPMGHSTYSVPESFQAEASVAKDSKGKPKRKAKAKSKPKGAVDALKDEFLSRPPSRPAEPVADSYALGGTGSDAIVRLKTPSGTIMRAIVTPEGVVARKG